MGLTVSNAGPLPPEWLDHSLTGIVIGLGAVAMILVIAALGVKEFKATGQSAQLV